MRKTMFVSCLAAMIWLTAASGCVKTSYTPAKGAESYAPTKDLVVLTYYPEQPYIVIGTLRARGVSQEKILAELRKQALRKGAEGIIVKPAAEVGNEYASERRSEFKKSELLVEAIAFRYKKPEQH